MKCIEDEIPFEVPERWEWCRLNSIATFELGKTLDTAKNTGTYKPYLRSVNVRWNSVDLNDINCMKFEPDELTRYSIKKGDLLICEGGDVGRSCVWEKDGEMYYQNALHRVRFYMNINPYFYMYIMMYYANSGKLQEICKGVTIKHLTRTTLLTLLFPLPPQNESLNIINKILEFDSLLQNLEENKNDISYLLSCIKSKILDLAIRGKLVPQDPNDEPASVLLERIRAEKEELIKQGKIKRNKKESIIFRGDDNSYYEKIGDEIRCIDEEIPFEIPDTWEWLRLENCCCKEIRRGKSPKYIEQSETLVFAQKCNTKYNGIDIGLALYLDESTLNKYPEDEYMQDGDIVINSTGTGTLGRIGFYRETDNRNSIPIVPDSHVTVIRSYQELHAFYLYAFMKANQSELEKKGEGSTNQKELKPLTLKELYVPVPPYDEQLRIVELIGNTFSIISTIEQSLS